MNLWPDAGFWQQHFLGDFLSIREALQTQWSTHAGPRREFSHALSGPDGECLATDCLWWGDVDASRVVVLLSATHGIEGYAGSAIQRYLVEGLQSGAVTCPPDTAVLVVHALTPWGMAWYRRCDEQGIDLNRHFIPDYSAPPLNPGFAAVRDSLRVADPAARSARLAALAQELGQRDYELAVSGGQYVDPLMPFYGGRQPNHGREVIETLFQEFALPQRDLLVLDLHTGLGPYGHAELICDHAPDAPATQLARSLFGAAVTEPELGTSASVPKHGLLDYAWHAIMNPRSCYLTLEFGTLGTEELFDSLIADHLFWAGHRPSARSDQAWAPVRERMLRHFCPADPHWRQLVILRSLQVFRRALEGVA